MRVRTIVFTGLLAVLPLAASAQGYAGKWEASGAAGGKCAAATAHITVSGSDITINFDSTFSIVLKGTVGPDGAFTAKGIHGATSADGKFAGDQIDFTVSASCGPRKLTGHRA